MLERWQRWIQVYMVEFKWGCVWVCHWSVATQSRRIAIGLRRRVGWRGGRGRGRWLLFPDRLDLIPTGEESSRPSQESQYHKNSNHHCWPSSFYHRLLKAQFGPKYQKRAFCTAIDVVEEAADDYERLSLKHYFDGWKGERLGFAFLAREVATE